MEKITVKVDDELFKKMNGRMERKRCKSISQCARELIDLGVKIEEAAESQEGEQDENGLHPMLVEMLKTNMIWVLESRFLLRNLTLKSSDTGSNSMNDFIKEAKERAKSAVTDLIRNSQKKQYDDDSE